MWCTGLVAPRHVGSSRTRARTRVPCIGRWILNHCATREVPKDQTLNVAYNPHSLTSPASVSLSLSTPCFLSHLSRSVCGSLLPSYFSLPLISFPLSFYPCSFSLFPFLFLIILSSFSFCYPLIVSLSASLSLAPCLPPSLIISILKTCLSMPHILGLCLCCSTCLENPSLLQRHHCHLQLHICSHTHILTHTCLCRVDPNLNFEITSSRKLYLNLPVLFRHLA